MVLYVRGDANCDAELNVADAMSILGNLFLSTEALCCEAAADLNADGLVNITDPISLLGFLFRQGPAPPYPFPDCGRAAKSELGCDGGSCG